MQPKRSL